MIKVVYVLHPGFVKSWTDGQEHFIGAPSLARLYGVDLRKCIIVHNDRPESYLGFKEEKDIKFKHLYPRGNGKYELEET